MTKIIENKVFEYEVGLKYDSHCSDCFGHLDWEIHNPGNLQGEKWVAFCNCNKNQRMWTLRAETYKTESING